MDSRDYHYILDDDSALALYNSFCKSDDDTIDTAEYPKTIFDIRRMVLEKLFD